MAACAHKGRPDPETITKGKKMAPRRKAPRNFAPEDLDQAIAFHGPRVARIQLWRRANRGRPGVWLHLGRFGPQKDLLTAIERRFGGGIYRCKLLGPWLPDQGRDAFLQQVTFRIHGAPTSETAHRLERLGYRPTVV